MDEDSKRGNTPQTDHSSVHRRRPFSAILKSCQAESLLETRLKIGCRALNLKIDQIQEYHEEKQTRWLVDREARRAKLAEDLRLQAEDIDFRRKESARLYQLQRERRKQEREFKHRSSMQTHEMKRRAKDRLIRLEQQVISEREEDSRRESQFRRDNELSTKRERNKWKLDLRQQFDCVKSRVESEYQLSRSELRRNLIAKNSEADKNRLLEAYNWKRARK